MADKPSGFSPQTSIPSANIPSVDVSKSAASVLGASSVSSSDNSAPIQKAIPGKTQSIHVSNWNKNFDYWFVTVDKNGNSVDECNLWVNPQAISISTPYSINITATNGGILEEHAGSIFRIISISGTTGVLPDREVKETKNPVAGTVFAQVFPAATSAIGGLFKQVTGLLGIDSDKKSLTPFQLKYTGYAQFWKLHNFFVKYAEDKKSASNSDLRLIFRSGKDFIGYICTPMSFELKRDAANPLQYKYSIQLKSWDIEDVGGTPNQLNFAEASSGSFLGTILDKISKARSTIFAAKNVIQGFQSDVITIMNGVNQAVLAVKDARGIFTSIVDFLPTIKNNALQIIRNDGILWAEAVKQQKEAQNRFAILFKPHEIVTLATPQVLLENIHNTTSNDISKLATIFKNTGSTSSKNSSPTGESADIRAADNAALKVFNKILSFPELADEISLQSVSPLPIPIQKQIEDQIDTAKQTTSTQIRTLVSKLQEVSDNHSYHAGMMDPFFAKTYALSPPPVKSNKKPTEDDILLAVQLQEAKAGFLMTLASGDIFTEKQINPFTSANEVTNDNDKISSPNSAYAVFVERGATIERIAQTHLGDPNRAREIAILNNLRAPYIDEEGFNRPISQSSGRTFIISDRTNIMINQAVTIQGNGVPSSRRTIGNIEDIGNGKFKITVFGNDNLDIYTPSTMPFIHARISGTVGSGDTVLIPSANAPDDPRTTRPSLLQNQLTHAEKVFKIDLAINTGDLVASPNGDVIRSYGYNNAVQALRILMQTEFGELSQHLTYGIPASVGDRIDGSVFNIIAAAIKSTILKDPRFSNASVFTKLNGTSLLVRVEAFGTEGTGRIPIEFQVNLAS